MWLIAIGVVAGLTAVWFADFCLCWAYVRAIHSQLSPRADKACEQAGEIPRISVLLPLRGADPHLRKAVQSILENDYPRLALFIVIDHPDDEASAVVAETVRETGATNVRVSFLKDRSLERSLICSSLIQAYDQAEGESDLIAFCAADMVIPANWYWEMARAMSDPEVGSLLGNRWYMSGGERLGSLVRHGWNAGAVILMWCLQIPWGGAAALRPSDARRAGLREKWARGLVEDVPIFDAARQIGLKLKFVPALTIVNREEIGLSGAYEFIKRQMLWARLYHSRWPMVLLHAVACLLVPLAPLALGVWALASGQWEAGALLIGGFVAYMLGFAVLLEMVELMVRRVLLARGEDVPARSLRYFLGLAIAIPLTTVLYPIAALACCFAREVVWRGIRYRIGHNGKVQMVEYTPFTGAPRAEEHHGRHDAIQIGARDGALLGGELPVRSKELKCRGR